MPIRPEPISDSMSYGPSRVPPAGGVLSYTNMPLRVLIRDAYQLDPYKESSALIAGPFVRLIGRSNGPTEPRAGVCSRLAMAPPARGSGSPLGRTTPGRANVHGSLVDNALSPVLATLLEGAPSP
jgi:hypothetical protein